MTQSIEAAVVFNTAERALSVKPYPATGGTVVTGDLDLVLLARTVGADRLLDAIGKEQAKIHFGLIDAPTSST